ncbi:MAG: methionyl-tRNA formyltransferase [Pseudothermotoga sp.]
MRIIFLGTPEFASRHLEAILDCGYDVVAVVTQPDKPFGRGQKIAHSPTKELAMRRGLAVFERLRDVPFDQLKADIGIVVAYGALIKEKYLNMLPLGFYNVHPSLLPKYRGAAPIQRALENGEKTTGITIFKLSKELDAGPVALQIPVTVDDYENFDLLEARLIEVGKTTLIEFLRKPESFTPKPQDESQATYAPKITSQDLVIDFSKSAKEVKDKIRAYDSYPGARVLFNGVPVKIFGVRRIESGETKEEPGTILHVDRDGGYISTADGIVVVLELQFPSKKRITFLSALNGRLIKIKDRFG